MEKNKEKFLEKSKKIHNNKYDYSLVEYKGDKIKVKIICPIHGMFEQEPHNHLKYGCFKCGVENSTKSRYYSTKEYIKKAIEIHGYKYDYSKTVYKKHDDKVIIICKEHGEFLQVARTHIKGSNCPKCVSNANMTTEKFIKKAMDAHKDKYNYSLVECNISSQKVKIICPLHGGI